MTIELMEPREGRISFPQPELVPLKSDIVLNDGQEIRATLSETYYIFVEFPTTHILYQEPDTDGEVSLEDLRAISKRHIVNEEVVDPEPGWPEGWKQVFVDTRGDIPLQGDIFTRIPFAVHLPGGDTFGHPNSPAMLLSHECDIAKPNNEIALLAVVRSAVDSINQDNLGHLRSRRLFHAVYLDDPPGLDGRDWYADCRFITAVHKDMLDLNHRLASLSDESREALRGHVIKFWNRTG